jgi:hypothetical protein
MSTHTADLDELYEGGMLIFSTTRGVLDMSVHIEQLHNLGQDWDGMGVCGAERRKVWIDNAFGLPEG